MTKQIYTTTNTVMLHKIGEFLNKNSTTNSVRINVQEGLAKQMDIWPAKDSGYFNVAH